MRMRSLNALYTSGGGCSSDTTTVFLNVLHAYIGVWIRVEVVAARKIYTKWTFRGSKFTSKGRVTVSVVQVEPEHSATFMYLHWSIHAVPPALTLPQSPR